MLFNSFTFAIFLPLVFAIHWGLGKSRGFQNIVVIVASCVFYAWWDVRFLSLIGFSSVMDFTLGLLLEGEQRQRRRRLLLLVSVVMNIGFLAVFKYFNFFLDSFAALVEAIGFQANVPTLRIILPVGISFYTFQSLSYTIDIYRRKIGATRNPLTFFAFVSFFPQLVAGPIQRASHLLPQFFQPRVFVARAAIEGLRQALWGMAKKVVVADNLAPRPNNQTYQIWVSSGGKYTSLGTFTPDSTGYARYVTIVPQGMASYDTAVVTIEVAGGATQRSGPFVFSADLTPFKK